ncbi:MAG: hypothetical protein J7M34_10430 [Anaerolineae bacterium]|nr:hypothetical protein [Anaerolineae bacterium]
MARAQREAEDIRNQAIAAAQLQAQMLRLQHREGLLDRVFKAAREKLTTIPQWSDYDQIVHHLAVEAIARLGAPEVRIRADERTMSLLTEDTLAAIAKETGVQVQLGEKLERGTGVIVETPDGHRQYDNTLETRLDRQQEALRPLVYRLLMGESL